MCVDCIYVWCGGMWVRVGLWGWGSHDGLVHTVRPWNGLHCFKGREVSCSLGELSQGEGGEWGWVVVAQYEPGYGLHLF